ncbi:MAG: biopolymer transporter ExbD [Cytophagales bacterium]|nr:biopolymer transporter ExbD [Cytophagales bacterium]
MSGHKFKKKAKSNPDIPTAALPDIIFMLLFFFMVVTVMREQEIMVKQVLPKATQLTKIEKKSLVSHIYIGEPTNTGLYGTEPRIQTNDVFVVKEDIARFVNNEKDKLTEVERDQIAMSMKVDIGVKMGIITDVQEELRNSNARKILYSAPRAIDK